MTNDFNIINSPKENGIFEFFTDLGSQFFKSLQCRHCGIHYQYVKNSGIQRGYCVKCGGPLCGKELCIKEDVPYEAQIEIEEGNKKTIMKYINTQTCQDILRKQIEISKKYNK